MNDGRRMREREREGETTRKEEEESLFLISLDPKFRQAHTEAQAVPVGLGPRLSLR